MPSFAFIDARVRATVPSRLLPWLILALACVNVIFVGGKRRCFGIFVSALHESFNSTSMTELNWIGDSYAALAFLLMPVTTGLILHFGRAYRGAMLMAAILVLVSCLSSATVPSPGWLFLTHTLLHGIGSSLILCTTALIVGEYFDKKHRFHVLATTLISGGPFGALLFGPLYSYWVYHLGWRTAFTIVGFCFFVEIMIGCIVFSPREFEEGEMDADRVAASKRKIALIPWRHCVGNPQIFFWFVHRNLLNIMLYGLLMNLTDFLADKVNSVEAGSRLALVFSTGECVTFAWGLIVGDKLRGRLPFVYMVSAFCSTVALVIWQFVYQISSLNFTFAFFCGAFMSVCNTFLYATAEEMLLIDGGVAYPVTKMGAAAGMLLSPGFSGYAIDRLGYGGFFMVMAVISSINMAMLIAANWFLLFYRSDYCEGERRVEEEPEMEAIYEKTRAPTKDESLL